MSISLRDEKKSPLAQAIPIKPNTLRRRNSFFSDRDFDGPRVYYEPAELLRFFNNVSDPFWHAYFYLQYAYGCRTSETALILDEDVNFKKHVIRIRRLKNPGETGYIETLHKAGPNVLQEVKEALKVKRKRKIEENPFLFGSKRAAKDGVRRLSQIRKLDSWQAISRFTACRMYSKYIADQKLPEHLTQSETLRYTRAVVLLADGMPPEEVRDTLGHSSISMTLRYLSAADAIKGKLSKDFRAAGLGA